MKRKLQGSVTVEAAFLVPMILLLISVTINLLFYYHDKVVLKGAVHETVMVMSSQEEISEEEMEQYFRKRTKNRLFLFPMLQLETEIEQGQVYLKCTSMRNSMQIAVDARMKRTNPEVWIRTINNLTGE